MESIFCIYIICTLICIAWNQKFYKKILLKDGYERVYGFMTYVLIVFCGPFSLVLTAYFKIRYYIKLKKMEKRLLKLVEEKLYEACAENDIKIIG